MKKYLKSVSPREREELAKKMKSSVGYFYQLAGGHRKPSPSFCKEIVKCEPRLKLADLRSDIWDAGS